ncbi:MAG: RdgB/HAM1 family non-canonical purine NTP pyrophosphatase [Pyrinomonadaceae bacterium]|nr:RdgB/HAM1 family non-canonical purine NTP pyrophosphatase [Pyrinomonadaceae bacterium]
MNVLEERSMKNRQPEILIATRNTGKIRELEILLADLPFRLRGLNSFSNIFDPEETGATFTENAVLKAKSYSLQTKLLSIADDSGLQVEALNGAPGVFSARYAGEDASDQDRIKKLLGELNEIRQRRARFVCVMAVADQEGDVKFIEEGVCSGTIALSARGAHGFGYDPIFIPDGFSATFGALPNAVKQQISHRARAVAKIIQQLRRFYAALT